MTDTQSSKYGMVKVQINDNQLGQNNLDVASWKALTPGNVLD